MLFFLNWNSSPLNQIRKKKFREFELWSNDIRRCFSEKSFFIPIKSILISLDFSCIRKNLFIDIAFKNIVLFSEINTWEYISGDLSKETKLIHFRLTINLAFRCIII